jgi:hypothetical protein
VRELIVVGVVLGLVGLLCLVRGLSSRGAAISEEISPSPMQELSDQDRIQIAVMNDRVLRMLP